MRRATLTTMLLTLALAGCVRAPLDTGGPDDGSTESTAPFRLDLLAPSTVSAGAPLVNAGEPQADFLPDGRLLVTFTGCDRMPAGTGDQRFDDPSCFHSPLFRQTADGGWERLGNEGRLHPDAPYSHGDAVVVVAPDGAVYHAAMHEEGLDILRSDDAGDTWTRLPPILDPRHDRPWLDVAADGSLMLSYRATEGLASRVSTDRGATWSPLQVIAAEETSDSPAVWRPDCGGGFLAYSVANGEDSYDVVFTRSDGANGWRNEPVATGVQALRVGLPDSVAPFRDALLAPDGLLSVAVAPDCTPFVAWAQAVEGDSGPGGGISRLKVAKPAPSGWNVQDVDLAADVVMPWIQADAQHVVVAAYGRSAVAGATQASAWDAVLGILRHDLGLEEVRVVDAGINAGDICTTNPLCVPTDRSVLDHIGLAVAPDGRLVFSYVAQPPLEGFQKTIRVVVSSSPPST